MLVGFRFMREESGIQRTRRRSINDEGHTKFYPGLRPLGRGSLHPASNLVYEHSVYREPRKRSCVARNVIYCMLICLRVPLGGFIYAAS
jgi:hypothetical protein